MKYFLDTNIVLDIFIEQRANHKNVKTLLKKVENADVDFELWIDRDSISTINYILRKESNRNEIILLIIESFNIANNTDILKNAIKFATEHDADYEDIVKVMTADKVESVVFLTADKKLLSMDKYLDISILDVEEMLLKFGYKKNLLGEFEEPLPDLKIEDILTNKVYLELLKRDTKTMSKEELNLLEKIHEVLDEQLSSQKHTFSKIK